MRNTIIKRLEDRAKEIDTYKIQNIMSYFVLLTANNGRNQKKFGVDKNQKQYN